MILVVDAGKGSDAAVSVVEEEAEYVVMVILKFAASTAKR